MQIAPNIFVKVGDITKGCFDAIVNAANSSLLGGGGVDGAIHRAGGPAILQECHGLRNERYPEGLPTGQAVSTTAGDMCSKYVIHTVGPVYAQCGGACQKLLASCYISSIQEARKLGCGTIAFPAISTGIYGYPKEEAARIAFEAVSSCIAKEAIKVTFLFHNESDKELFLKAIR